MTDSTAKTPRDNLDDFDNDLDAVLNDAALSLDGINALPDDEDAIDRLLMDDSFDTADESTQSVGIKEKLVDDITLPEFDEFTGFDDVVDDFEQLKLIPLPCLKWIRARQATQHCWVIILLKLMI
jgi:hypothetical protein